MHDSEDLPSCNPFDIYCNPFDLINFHKIISFIINHDNNKYKIKQ